MNSKVAVLIASDYYSPHWTGIVKAVSNLVKCLSEVCRLSVLTVRYDPTLLPEEAIDGARVIRCAPVFRVSRASYSLSAVFRCFKEMAHHDVLLINSPCTNVLPYALAAKLRGKRVVIFHQGDLTLRAGFVNRCIELVFLVSTLGGFALADTVSTYTEDYAKQSRVLKWFLSKFRPMLMPMLPRSMPEAHPNSVLPMLELKSQGKVLFGFAGRFVYEKGFDLLFRAIPELVLRVPNAHFVFAGEVKIAYEDFFSECHADFERARKHITMLGLLPEHELWSFYRLIDFVVVPSRSDCFPLVQMEACLCGKPTVVTDIPGARYLQQVTGFGLVCKPNDEADLVSKLAAVIEQRAVLMERYPAVLQFLDLDSVVKNCVSVISGKEVVDPKRQQS